MAAKPTPPRGIAHASLTTQNNSATISKTKSRAPKSRGTASNLYLKGNVYYFRYAFPNDLRNRLGRTEIRLSLRTAYRKSAKERANLLRVSLEILTRDISVDYQELRRRLVELLCEKLESDALDPSERHPYPAITKGKPNIPAAEIHRHIAEMMDADINNPRFREEYREELTNLVISDGIASEQELIENNEDLIINEYLKYDKLLHEVLARRYSGDHHYESQFFAERNSLRALERVNQINHSIKQKNIRINTFTEQITQKTQSHSSDRESNHITYSTIMEQYIEDRVASGNWRETTLTDRRKRLTRLIEILGDRPLSTIDRKDIRRLRDTLRRLPPNIDKAKEYKGKSIEDVLSMNPIKTLSITTINGVLGEVSCFFEWAQREGFATENPAKDLMLPDRRKAIDKRDTLTSSDITKIFSAPRYRNDNFQNAAYFWCPLIGLFTGMRLEEIAQLHLADIYEHEDEGKKTGVWVIDINDNPAKDGSADKRLKTTNAKRKIPIHKALIDIGLLRYHQGQTQRGEERLFPMLRKTEKVSQYGKQPGKQFTALLKECHITGKKSFHSLRHAFSDFFKKRNMHGAMFNEIFGHEQASLATRQYGGEFPPPQVLNDLISFIDYDIDIAMLSKSKFAIRE